MNECRDRWVGPLFQLNSQTEPVMIHVCRANSYGKLGHQNIMLQIEINFSFSDILIVMILMPWVAE